MPDYPINPGMNFRVKFYCSAPPQLGINVRFINIVDRIGAGLNTEPFASALSTFAAPRYRAALGPKSSYWGLSIQELLVTPFTPTIAQDGQGVGTGFLGGNLPEQVSGIISVKTDFIGRANRGRVYVPFPPTDASDTATTDTIPTLAYVAALTAMKPLSVGLIAVDDGAGNGFHIQWSLFRGLANPMAPITTGSAQRKFATQRRRGDYGRGNPLPA